MPEARLLKTVRQQLSPWVTLVAKDVARGGAAAQTYHSLSQSDYVSVLALTPDGRVPLVRQYRPAVERVTLELPGGLLDSAEAPEQVAMRELVEEAGLHPAAAPILLGKLAPDTGRLENRFWSYFVRTAAPGNWTPEADVERVLLRPVELRAAIDRGEFDHALHIAVLGLALMRGLFSFEVP
jgi:ADP-ribose pyrophosphatase